MRVKRGVKARKRRNRVFKIAKGFRGRSNNTIRQATQRAEKSLTYAYRDRKAHKRGMRRLWVVRINASARLHDMSYSQFMFGLKSANVELDRKMLADLGALHPEVFSAIAVSAKSQVASA